MDDLPWARMHRLSSKWIYVGKELILRRARYWGTPQIRVTSYSIVWDTTFPPLKWLLSVQDTSWADAQSCHSSFTACQRASHKHPEIDLFLQEILSPLLGRAVTGNDRLKTISLWQLERNCREVLIFSRWGKKPKPNANKPTNQPNKIPTTTPLSP